MFFKWKKYAVVLSLLALARVPVQAQYEKITEDTFRTAFDQYPELRENARNPYMKALLGAIRPNADHTFISAMKVAGDLQAAKQPFPGKVVYYSVPAMSDVMRLPNTYPMDGKAFGEVRIFAARDEYEPGSFVVYPLADLGKVRFELTALQTQDGKAFPADKLDLKVIKVWYQNGNGWFNYFGDYELKLTPELLLNDEDLIRVDTKAVQNYARLTDPNSKSVSYQWLTPPFAIDKRKHIRAYRGWQTFQPMKENFRDAATLQPVTLSRGEFKQFFLTAHVTKDQAPGIYRGAVRMVKDGQEVGRIPVALRVLPFELPQPYTYYDTHKPFLVSSYNYTSLEFIQGNNGHDTKRAMEQLENVLKNLVSHNQTMFMIRGETNRDLFEYNFTLDLMKKVGMRTDFFMDMGGGRGGQCGQGAQAAEHNAKMTRTYFDRKLGPNSKIFLMWGDEPPVTFFINGRNTFAIYQKHQVGQFIAAKDQAFFGGGYYLDFFNFATAPEIAANTRKWNEVGHAWVAWYASQHVGPENPAYNRRQNGIAPYLANFSALCNYAHHFGSYNDRAEGYRPMVFAYGSGDGVLDTIQWEGFREGIDDIRYATCLKRLAEEAEASPDLETKYAGRIARQMFSEIDSKTCDMNELRMEMIAKIMELRALLKK